MTIEDIRQLIAVDEHRQLEMKKTTGELKDAMRSLCAMLNSDGGYVMVQDVLSKYAVSRTYPNLNGKQRTAW